MRYRIITKMSVVTSVSSEDKDQSNYLRQNSGKCYIDCPFSEKDVAKKMGAKWDKDKKKWYVPRGTNVTPFFELWKTYCRVCNSQIVCDYRGCDETNAGICCIYDWTGKGHCDWSESDVLGWHSESKYYYKIKRLITPVPVAPQDTP